MKRNSTPQAIGVIILEFLAGILGIIAFLSFLLIIFRHYLGLFDKTIIDWVYSIRSESLNELMSMITFLGGGVFLTGGILLFLLIIYNKHKVQTFNFSVLLFFGTFINLLLKWLYQRPRPDYLPLAFESTYSFPSGHAMNSFIFYTCLVYFIFRTTKNKNVRLFVFVFFSLLVLLIGFSRVYLGVHYPSDVLAGYIGGFLWFGVILLIEKTAHKFNLFKQVL